MAEVYSPRYRWSALACAAVAVALWMGPYLIRSDIIADDASQHLFWMYRFIDSAYFPNDISVAYFGDTSAAPWGYRGLYFLLSRFVDLQPAGEWTAVALLLFNIWLIWKICVTVDRGQPELRALAAVTVMLVMLSSQLTDIMSPLALQRSFALSFLLVNLWGLVTGRYAWLGVSWLLAALVYPIVLVVMGLTSLIQLGGETLRQRRLPRATVWNLLAGIASIVIVLLNMNMPEGVGPTITEAQARAMAEYHPGGRIAIFGFSAYGDWLNDHHLALGYSLRQVALIGAATALVLWAGRARSVPRAIWILAATGLATWFISRQMLFKLYLPNRHSRWSVACFAIMAGSSAACIAIGYAERWRESLKLPEWLRPDRLAAIGAPLIVAMALLPGARYVYRTPVDVDMNRAYQFLQTLPKSTLVAAYPDLADMVPMMARRSVLASTEMSLPWGVTYYQKLRPRIEASLRIAYATSIEELDAAAAPYGVDVVLSDGSVWGKPDYYKPFDGLAHSLRERGERLGYVLRSPPPDRILFHSGDVYVLQVRRPAPAGP